MSTSRSEPNPLRPYYRPPSIGIPQDLPGTTSTGTHGLGPKNGSAASYASSARDMFSDIDYSDYLSDSSPSPFETINRQLNEWVYKYFTILLAHPFDVSKTILQVRDQGELDGTISGASMENVRLRSSYQDTVYNEQYPSDDDDELAYFTSAAPTRGNSAANYDSFSRSRQRPPVEREYSPSPPKTPAAPQHQLTLKRPDSILEVISQEWTKESAWGVWKGSNTTFMYHLLHETLEKWARGLLAALLNVPDPGFMPGTAIGAGAELLDAPYPWASLGVAVAAAVATGVILAPLDLIRTKLVVTPVSSPNRSLTQNIRNLPSLLCPSSLLAPTTLHALISPTINHSTPILLRSQFAVDPVLTPNTYSIAKFMSRTVELFLKLPLETVLRRGQVNVLRSPKYRMSRRGEEELETVVPIGEYRGVIGTMWCIAREEGVREVHVVGKGKGKGKVKEKVKKGQGIEGLWRGWRVGMWGLAGVWGAGLIGGGRGGDAGEF